MSNLDKTTEDLKNEIKQSSSYKTKYMGINSLKWDPNMFYPKLLGNTTPLNDCTNTPREVKRAITLERTFD